MAMFKKKIALIEAIQFTGNDKECLNFCPNAIDPIHDKPSLLIPVHGGKLPVRVSDWIIKNQDGSFSVMPNESFIKLYEPI